MKSIKKKKILILTTVLIIFLFTVVLQPFNFSNSVNFFDDPKHKEERRFFDDNEYPKQSSVIEPKIVAGVSAGIASLDPLDTWDSASFDVIDQVTETLLKYDTQDPNLPIMPGLAQKMGYWSIDNLNYTLELNEGIKFHDGTDFNASAVKWNFDRIHYLINETGEMPMGMQHVMWESLLRFGDGTLIINNTVVINNTAIKFVLNRPFAAFEALLCFSGFSMLSPTSTPDTSYIDTWTGDLVGTGPFEYEGYYTIEDLYPTDPLAAFLHTEEIWFKRFENYWRSLAEIEELKFLVIPDQYSRNELLLDGEINFLLSGSNDFRDQFMSSPELVVSDYVPQATLYYLAMNNINVNRTFREAISYAIDYEDIINYHGQATKAKSILPENILYSNPNLDYPIFNLSLARSKMQSMGYGLGFTEDWEWLDADFKQTTYMYLGSSQFFSETASMISDCLDLIGIEVILDPAIDWGEFLNRLYQPDTWNLTMMGWGADYNDPSNFINPLCSNTSETSNYAQVNDPYLETLMAEGLNLTDPSLREQKYNEIQQYLVEYLMPYAWLFNPTTYSAYSRIFTGYQPNALGRINFYDVQLRYPAKTQNDPTFRIGMQYDIATLDPHDAWDSTSIDVIEQITETLLYYNLSDPELEIIPKLATDLGNWSVNGLNYTINLRSGITFHDGTEFNASSVQWSFNRVAYFMNITGSLPKDILTTQFDSLYRWPDGTPIINRTEVIGQFKIRFVLNRPYAPFEGLLCFSGSSILSPTSTPQLDYIDTFSGDLIGTGPYVFDNNEQGKEINLHGYENYWRGIPNLNKIKFVIIQDPEDRKYAMSNGFIDLEWPSNLNNIEQYSNNSNINVYGPQEISSFYYIGMNNKLINDTWREAISYSINYTYLIEEIIGNAKRLKTPIPKGIMYHNGTLD
ncbi:MAG: ABC transporter substrate-binding protein, partial [Promethearchaeota archaeon]